MTNSVSVIVTYCDADECFLKRCLASIEWQLASGDELITVFDGHGAPVNMMDISTGSTVGPAAARNIGWQKAKGDWIKFIDVDDFLFPHALANFRKISEIPSECKVIAGGKFNLTNQQGLAWNVPDKIPQMMMVQNPLLVSQCFLRRDIKERFDERIHFEEDWDLWLKIFSESGADAFGVMNVPVCIHSVDVARRAEIDKTRDHTVEGMDVRAYFQKTYGARPR